MRRSAGACEIVAGHLGRYGTAGIVRLDEIGRIDINRDGAERQRNSGSCQHPVHNGHRARSDGHAAAAAY